MVVLVVAMCGARVDDGKSARAFGIIYGSPGKHFHLLDYTTRRNVDDPDLATYTLRDTGAINGISTQSQSRIFTSWCLK